MRTQNGSLLCLNEGPGVYGSAGCHGYVRSPDDGSTWHWVPVAPHSYAGGGFSRVANGTGASGSGVLVGINPIITSEKQLLSMIKHLL